MDRWWVRSVEDFWAIIEEHRGGVSLRDLKLRRGREPRLARVFTALREIGLQLRWSSPEAAIDDLHALMLDQDWSPSDLAEHVGVSARTATRLAAKELPSFSIFLEWCSASERDFFVEVGHARCPAASRSNDIQETADHDATDTRHPAAAPEAATLRARSGQAHGHAEAEAAESARSGQGGPADVDTPPQAAEHSGRSGPRSAHREAAAPEAATAAGRSGQVVGPREISTCAVDRSRSPSMRAHTSCLFRHGRSGQRLETDTEETKTAFEKTGESKRYAGRSGHVEGDTGADRSAEAASISTPFDDDDAARKKVLSDEGVTPHADRVEVHVEWKKGGEVVCSQWCAREDLKAMLRAMSRVPGVKDATVYVDGRRRRKRRKRRRSRAAEVALIEQAFAKGIEPLLKDYAEVGARLESIERGQASAQTLSDNIQNLQRILAPIPGPSRLQCLVRAFVDELGGEAE